METQRTTAVDLLTVKEQRFNTSSVCLWLALIKSAGMSVLETPEVKFRNYSTRIKKLALLNRQEVLQLVIKGLPRTTASSGQTAAET